MTQSLKEQYQQLHMEGKFQGYSALKHKDSIAALVRRNNPETLLDYGSGKGDQYHEKNIQLAWGGLLPDLYDPYYPPLSEKPIKIYDGVICTDVMEHVPEEDVQSVLREIMDYSNSFIFLSICTRPAKKNLPDGRNCHLTVKGQDWWHKQIVKAKNGRHLEVVVEYVE